MVKTLSIKESNALFRARWIKLMGSKGRASQTAAYHQHLAALQRAMVEDNLYHRPGADTEYEEIMKTQALMEKFDGTGEKNDDGGPAET